MDEKRLLKMLFLHRFLRSAVYEKRFDLFFHLFFDPAVDEKRFDLFFRLAPNVLDFLEKKTSKNKLQQTLLQIGFVGDVQVSIVFRARKCTTRFVRRSVDQTFLSLVLLFFGVYRRLLHYCPNA